MPGGKHILGKQNAQRVFGTAKVGDRGQIVIPKEAREVFGIEEKEYVYSEVVDHIRSVATQENMSYICSECSWYPISACRRNILNK